MAKTKTYPGYQTEKKIGKIQQFTLRKNGLRVLFMHMPDTGVVTSSLVYKVGSRDEGFEETGLAHMLEHMMFKPTVADKKRRTESASMLFERETGARLNANTWRDRTQYYFSYPTEHFARAISIEAERMRGLTLEDKEFLPERGNVLSEFDMYNGDPYFALAMAMSRAAYLHHPYGHEVIGFRQDIENYTVAKLQAFYDRYYWPNNATFVIAGDIALSEVLTTIKQAFGDIAPAPTLPRHEVQEMKQEGLRTTAIERPTPTSIFALGVKHAAFPEQNWFTTSVIASLLTEGQDSLLHKALVDTNLATSVSCMQEPSSEENLAIFYITLTEAGKKQDIQKIVEDVLTNITAATVRPYLKKIVAGITSDEAFTRSSSYGFVTELVEYESAGATAHFYDSEKMIKSITPKAVVDLITKLFVPANMTIGTLNYTR